MRLVHLSDLHLGYRQYQRLTPGGLNQREADVAATFRTAIDRVIALRPDAVVVAGDVFHSVRPTNQAIISAFLQFARLRAELPDAAIVIVAGNHDVPRTTETGGILRLLAQTGVDVVDSEAKRLSYEHLGLSVLAVPGGPGQKPAFTVDPSAKYNVLVLHGVVPGIVPQLPGYEPINQYQRSELTASPWTYIAMGDYHVYQEVAPHVYYSGSLEYTSLNPWRDVDLESERRLDERGKGFIERNLETGDHRFHVVPAARKLIDLPVIQGKNLTAADVDARIRETVDRVKGGIDDQVVRLVIRDVSRQVARDLDHKTIRDYKRRALNFHLDVRRPDLFRHTSSGGAPGRRVELKEVVAEKLRTRPLDADVDREALVARAVGYIDEAQSVASAAPSLVAEA